MTHVALTSPRLVFTIGLTVIERPGRRDGIGELAHALDQLGGPVTRGTGVGWFAVELADSVDAVLALQAMRRTLGGFDLDVHSVVGSTAAIDLLADPVAANAWGPLRAELVTDDDRRPDLSRGCAAARHSTRLLIWPTPDAIAAQQLPDTPGLILWSVGDGRIVVVDRDPFTIGRDPMCDLHVDATTVSRRHASFARTAEGWQIGDAGSSSGFSIDGRRVASHAELRPGMVIQLARPNAFVVLAMR